MRTARDEGTKGRRDEKPKPIVVEGVLHDGQALRLGLLRVVRNGGLITISVYRRGMVDRIVLDRLFGFTALGSNLPPEIERGCVKDAFDAAAIRSSGLTPQASSLPLVRLGQGDFARDLLEEDLR